VAFGRGCGFASERLLGQLDHGWNLAIGRRSQFLLVLGHEARPKTTLYGVVFQKIEWAPAYRSAAAYPGCRDRTAAFGARGDQESHDRGSGLQPAAVIDPAGERKLAGDSITAVDRRNA